MGRVGIIDVTSRYTYYDNNNYYNMYSAKTLKKNIYIYLLINRKGPTHYAEY